MALRKNGTNVTNATSATLTLANVQTSDAGSYTVEVRNACTTLTSSAASVTVLAPGAGAVLSLSPSTVDFGSVRVGVLDEQVLDGILAGSPRAAEARMREHLDKAVRDLTGRARELARN